MLLGLAFVAVAAAALCTFALGFAGDTRGCDRPEPTSVCSRVPVSPARWPWLLAPLALIATVVVLTSCSSNSSAGQGTPGVAPSAAPTLPVDIRSFAPGWKQASLGAFPDIAEAARGQHDDRCGAFTVVADVASTFRITTGASLAQRKFTDGTSADGYYWVVVSTFPTADEARRFAGLQSKALASSDRVACDQLPPPGENESIHSVAHAAMTKAAGEDYGGAQVVTITSSGQTFVYENEQHVWANGERVFEAFTSFPSDRYDPNRVAAFVASLR